MQSVEDSPFRVIRGFSLLLDPTYSEGIVCTCLYWSEQEEIGSAEEKAWMGDRKIGYTQKMRTSGVVARTKVLVPIYLASYLALLCAN